MAIARTSTAQVINNGTTTGTFTISGIADGSWMILTASLGNTSTTLTDPAGWTPMKTAFSLGSRRGYQWGRIKQSGDTTVSLVKSGSVTLSASLVYGTGSDPVADWIIGTTKLRATAPAETVTTTGQSVNTGEANTLALGFSIEATTATEGTAPVTSGTGWANWHYVAQLDATNIDQIRVSYKDVASSGASGDVTETYANTQANNGAGWQVILTPSAPSNVAPTAAYTHSETYLYMTVDGTTSTDSDGTITTYDWDWGDGTSHGSGSTSNHTYTNPGTYTVILTVTDDDGATDTESKSISVTASPKLFLGTGGATAMRHGNNVVTALYQGANLVKRYGYTVTDFIADNPAYIAHRGLGTSYPEQSMAGYDAAVAAGFKCLEVSVRASSDGVFVASHDATTSRVFTTNYTVASTSWATLSALNSATGPILRLEDILNKYGSSHVIFIDIKSTEISLGGYDTAMLDILDNYPNSTSHFVWKGFRGWSPSADTWTAAGYKSWGIYYDAEIGTTGSPHSSVSHFDWLGLNWDASQTNWDVAIATGKRTFAHVIGADSDRTTGAGKGATGFMITNINAMP